MEKERIGGKRHLSFFDLMPYHHGILLRLAKEFREFCVWWWGIYFFLFNFMSYHHTIPWWTYGTSSFIDD
jgi:hypothetical protein